MPPLHDPTVRDAMRARVRQLSPNTARKWGKMSVDQMLRHISVVLAATLGQTQPAELKPPLPKPLMKFMVLNVPWPKGAPTHPDFVVGERSDFEAERQRALNLIEQFTSKPMDATDWPPSPIFGKMSGRESSRLQAKHLDHHLKQFSV